MDAIMWKAFRCGVQYDKNHFITYLMYADDSATDIFYVIARIGQSYGLKITVTRQKYWQQMDHQQSSRWQPNRASSKIQIPGNYGTREESSDHSRGPYSNWSSSRGLCFPQVVPVEASQHLHYNHGSTLILPVLLYDSETWTLLKPNLAKLEVF